MLIPTNSNRSTVSKEVGREREREKKLIIVDAPMTMTITADAAIQIDIHSVEVVQQDPPAAEYHH